VTTFTIDMVYSQGSGTVQLVLDWSDPALTTLDIEEGLQDGSLREAVLEQVRQSLGDELAEQLAAGIVPMICADTDRGARREVDVVLGTLPLSSPDDRRSVNRITEDAVLSRDRQVLENDG
jgi:hypothetical protein